MIFSFYDFSLNFPDGSDIFLRNFKKIFTFSSVSTFETGGNLWIKSLQFLFINIKYVIAGTFVGFVIALITSFFSSDQFNNKIICNTFKFVLFFLRAVPEIVFILIFKNTLESADTILLLAYFWFSWLWLHKYFVEVFKTVDTKFYYLSIRMGNSKIRSFFREIYPRIDNKIIGLLLYSFESNIRWASLLSNFGLIGIGLLTNHAAQNAGTNIEQLGIPLLILILFILSLELGDYLFRNFVLKHLPFIKISKNNFLKWIQINWQKIFKLILLLFLIIFSIYIFFSLNYSIFKNNFLLSYTNNFFKPDFSVFNLSIFSIEFNPIIQSLQIWIHTFFTLIILFFLVLLFLPFLIENQNSKYTITLTKFWLIVFRSVPSIIVFFVFSPLFNSSSTLILIILAFHSCGSILKQLSDSVNKIDASKFKNLKLIGWGKFKIYKHYVLPYLKKDLVTLFTIYMEIMFRSIILYSSLSEREFFIGGKLFIYLNGRVIEFNKAFAYMWIIMFNIFVLNIVTNLILNFEKVKQEFLKIYNKFSKTKVLKSNI
ncbi:transporter permease [Mycoplasmopsis citelli]|uniref:ABC transporter permease subunit n=1 Tax=Mycoplasmopsis citelli TaxID=171281 RepID=UPI0021153886|nr:ABC transporter permease subunit [Mycoplasmopsis citelli]UUD36204.1 transporter permease [Mycoplasmopsis citelli]